MQREPQSESTVWCVMRRALVLRPKRHHGDEMAALSPASKRALSNLRAFVPPKTNYYQCPLKRRAAVLILLFADKVGDLRVVLTIRSAGLKNCKSVVRECPLCLGLSEEKKDTFD